MITRTDLLIMAADMLFYECIPNESDYREMTLEEQDSLIYSFHQSF